MIPLLRKFKSEYHVCFRKHILTRTGCPSLLPYLLPRLQNHFLSLNIIASSTRSPSINSLSHLDFSSEESDSEDPIRRDKTIVGAYKTTTRLRKRNEHEPDQREDRAGSGKRYKHDVTRDCGDGMSVSQTYGTREHPSRRRR
jgi:hypothetical protein